MNFNFIVLLFFFKTCLFAQTNEQNLIGDWFGSLSNGASDLKIIFHIEKKDNKLVGTMDSPDQGAFGLNLNDVSYNKGEVILDMSVFKISYKGQFYTTDSIIGEFKQGTYSTTLNLKKSTQALATKPNRPQEPKAPFPYKIKDITFKNDIQKFKLAGTLTIPEGKGPFPAVILVSGSGQQNRDSELMGHKPFWVIADYLSRNGIAVLRYDDRGMGQSEGDFQAATTADFAYDAQSAYIFLKKQKKIDKNRIGIVGHSEGGMVAQMVAAADTQVRLIVLLASPGVPISELMLKQTEMTLRQSGISEEEIQVSIELNKKFYNVLLNQADNTIAKKEIEQIIQTHANSMTSEEASEIKRQQPLLVKTMLTPWFRYFINFNPEYYLKQIKCPVLAINGEKDVQVSCEENLFGIAMSLEKYGNRRYEFHKMPNLNHLLQNCESGSVSEYMKIEETISPEILKIMRDWIKAR
jgi:uncharacterized protein